MYKLQMETPKIFLLFILLGIIGGIIMAVLGSKMKDDKGKRTPKGNVMMTAGLALCLTFLFIASFVK
jgi:hypothetical protein